MARSLAETNPFLKDPEARKRSIARSVTTSSAVEGIRVTITKGKAGNRPQTIAKNVRSSRERPQ